MGTDADLRRDGRKGRGERGSALAGVSSGAEQGFVLVGLIVVMFFILLALSIAAPTVAKELKRERELEMIHRGNQYVRAVQLYYRKTGTYPASMDALGKSNNIRFLRQQYIDPMTGKVDWKLIHVGEAKTTVKGFFGQPLAGLAPGLGSAANMASPGGIGAGAAGAGTGSAFGGGAAAGSSAFGGASGSGSSGFGSSGSSSFGSSSFGSSSGSSSFGSSSFGSSSPGSSSFGTNSVGSGSAGGSTTPGGSSTGTDSSGTNGSGNGSGTGSSNGSSSQSATAFSGGGAPFVGVGLPKHGDSIVVLNEQKTYQTWEFIYDPRIEQMKSRSNLLGGGGAAAGGLGSASSLSSGVGGTGSSPSGFGSGSNAGSSGGFGSSSGFGSSGGFGSSPSSGFGSSGFGSSGSSGNAPQNTQAPQ